jgi:hypothetical protein
MLKLPRRWMVLFACLVAVNAASAQEDARRVFTFSGTVAEKECAQLPGASFEIGPSGDRWKSDDRLEVDCVPWATGRFATLILTFTIFGEVLPAPAGGARNYTFRWGKAIDRSSPTMVGQFTSHPRRCELVKNLLTTKVSRTPASASEQLRRPATWSASCNGDDAWGTSMEIVLTANLRETP